MFPRRAVRWCLGSFSIAFASLGSLSERQEDCEARGGSLVWVALQMSQYFGQDFFEALLVEPPKEDLKEAKNHICVPRNCAGHAQISGDHCENVKGWVIQTLLEAHQHAHGGLGYDHVFQTELLHTYPWMLKGVNAQFVPQPLFPLTACMHCMLKARVSISEGLPGRVLRIAVWSSHAPLAAAMAEHVEAVVEDPHFVYYGVCYLCEHTSTCSERRQDSMADQSCDHFHKPDDVPLKLWLDTAEDVAQREWKASFLMCFGLAFCHFWFSLMSGTPRLQLLCMNPLQGTPRDFAALMLLDLRRRVLEAKPDDQVLATNAVTSSLLAYHVGKVAMQIPVTTLFRQQLMAWSHVFPWGWRSSSDGSHSRTALLTSSFILQMSSVYLAFRLALRQSFQSGNLYELLEHRHDVFWTLQSEGDVADFLQHAFTIYVPEHPYKNYFNDLYALRLPIFTPNIEFLSRLWPEVKSLDTHSCYDGWFDRTIPRTRLLLSDSDLDAATPEAKLQEVPEPFDLSSDGYKKARTWLDSSDYFHFPGVMHFRSIPDLYSQVMSETLEVSLLQAREVMDEFARQRRAEALQYFAGAVGAKRGEAGEKDSACYLISSSNRF